MAVQTAIANAKKAEQDTVTVTERGKAEAAKAKWEAVWRVLQPFERSPTTL